MTVIAFDGVTLAADKMADCNGTIRTVTKIWRGVGSELLAGAGDASSCIAIRDWYLAGADPALFPQNLQPADLWVVKRLGKMSDFRIMKYEGNQFAVTYEDRMFACGCGRDYALGAMAMGATAEQAVEVASRLDTYCGCGVDTLEFLA